jgi:hypothetical protein
MHNVGHEGEGGEVVGEGATEEPEVGEGGEGGAEVVLDDCWWDVLLLDGGESLEADAVGVVEIFLIPLLVYASSV